MRILFVSVEASFYLLLLLHLLFLFLSFYQLISEWVSQCSFGFSKLFEVDWESLKIPGYLRFIHSSSTVTFQKLFPDSLRLFQTCRFGCCLNSIILSYFYPSVGESPSLCFSSFLPSFLSFCLFLGLVDVCDSIRFGSNRYDHVTTSHGKSISTSTMSAVSAV